MRHRIDVAVRLLCAIDAQPSRCQDADIASVGIGVVVAAKQVISMPWEATFHRELPAEVDAVGQRERIGVRLDEILDANG